jgi:hypothetical protein
MNTKVSQRKMIESQSGTQAVPQGFSAIGRVRLARVIKASIQIQGLSYREMEFLSGKWYGEAINKNSIGSYIRAATRTVSPFMCQKLSPFVFHVEDFADTEDGSGLPIFQQFGLVEFDKNPSDPVGDPYIPESVRYSLEKHRALMNSEYISELPDAHLRGNNFNRLIKIAMFDFPGE